ncbi:dTDP-4-dehydrorhamnose 3,5-epimerase [sulfur-oxidizing endosymbiont of Gigantopelta aegis]|uniref:dTDP-4-dehydrorhamnose 3,5-epimerase n=1 Tax=sulfur-oxidizing endosymbiont of Gigantopelta aegis TaxID=2794934 RepID=UPI0018DE9C4C|nr:dTDP-4-dehydrorhamnose 3,5-epimerase [sulfur-oxidizing endosymbiont of Gigantopelta aegis]
MTSRFKFNALSLAGAYLIEQQPMSDQRGYFSRFYCAEEFKSIGLEQAIAQMNVSYTGKKGSIRGMHFQYPPQSETKIVTCLQGEIFDVIVDLRKNSDTFLQWHGEKLSAKTPRSLYIPAGFAHGFQTLSDDCQLLYLHTEAYAPGAEGALNVMEPQLAIPWPLPISEISQKDSDHPLLNESFEGLKVL